MEESKFTPEFIAKMRALANQAWSRPWGAQGVGFGTRILGGPKHTILADMKNRNHKENAEYLTAAANHFPDALDTIEWLSADNAVMAAILDRLANITSDAGALFFDDDLHSDWTAALDWIEKHLSLTPEESVRARHRETIKRWRDWVSSLNDELGDAYIQNKELANLLARYHDSLHDMLSLIDEHGDNIIHAHAHRILKARQTLAMRAKPVDPLRGWIRTDERRPEETETVNAVYHNQTVTAFWQEQAEGDPENGFDKYAQWFYMPANGHDEFKPMQTEDSAPEFPDYWQPLPSCPQVEKENA